MNRKLVIYGGVFLVAKANLSLGVYRGLRNATANANAYTPGVFALELQLQMTSPQRRSDKAERVIWLYESHLR